MKYDLQIRRRWFDEYLKAVELGVLPIPPVGSRVTCPCCGFPTIPERSGWEICRLCEWEDDGQDDPEADQIWGGPNYELSLSDARQNFEHHLTKYNLTKPPTSIRGNENTPVEARTKARMIGTFEKMITEPDSSRLNTYWYEIESLEMVLGRELSRIVRNFEQRNASKRARR